MGQINRGEPGGKTVGTSSTSLLEANTKRVKFSIFNPNTYSVWMAAGVAALLNKGGWLSPGGKFDVNDPNEACLAWNGIAAASNGVTWLEFLEP